jgi:hypothetical protein
LARTAAKITQADVARVLRAVKQTGTSARIEVKPDGSIVIDTIPTVDDPKGQLSPAAGKVRLERKAGVVLC